VQFLSFDETPDTWQEVLIQPVAGVHDQLEARAAQGIENAVLDVHNVLRVGGCHRSTRSENERRNARPRAACGSGRVNRSAE